MTWRVVAASQAGTSHAADGRPCEDSCWAQVDTTVSGQEVLSIFVCDGAGSAKHGGEGAELAVAAAAEFIARQLKRSEFALNDQFGVDCTLAVRERLYAMAEHRGVPARELACTFLGVVVTPTQTLALQIGDGGIVLDVCNGLEVAVAPMSGEYANMTHFVTDEDAVTQLATKVYPEQARCVAAFSDGLQRLALNLTNNTPHAPFFAPFFKVLGTTGEGREDELQHALRKFLDSQPVNERTDDDKTLALAVRVTDSA